MTHAAEPRPTPIALGRSTPAAGHPPLAEFLAGRTSPAAAGAGGLRGFLEAAEAWRIRQALDEAGGNRSAAARALGIGRRTLYTKLAKLGLG